MARVAKRVAARNERVSEIGHGFAQELRPEDATFQEPRRLNGPGEVDGGGWADVVVVEAERVKDAVEPSRVREREWRVVVQAEISSAE